LGKNQFRFHEGQDKQPLGRTQKRTKYGKKRKKEEKSTQAKCSTRQATRVSAVEMMDVLGVEFSFTRPMHVSTTPNLRHVVC
jgi:hypothetical protein